MCQGVAKEAGSAPVCHGGSNKVLNLSPERLGTTVQFACGDPGPTRLAGPS